jgi:PAS domain S-box-containing protein
MTNRKRAEEARWRSQTQLIQAQRLSHTGSWSLNLATGSLSWSEEHFRILGLDPSTEPTYPTALNMIHPEDRSFVQRTLETSIRDRSVFEVDCRILRPDGTVRNIHSLGEPVFNYARELTDYVGTIIDVTEHKRAEEKLRESERRFRLLAESIPHHVWSFRPDGTVAYWNQRLLDYTGLTSEELRRGGWEALHPEDTERVKAAWLKALAHSADYEMEQRLRGRDGQYRRFLCRGVAVRDEQGRPTEWFGTDTDIEERRKAEEALHKAKAELAHVTRLTTIGEITASIAHEINQPLTAIVSNANACRRMLEADSPALDEIRQAIGDIADSGKRAADVVARARALLRKSRPEKSMLDVNQLITEILTFVRGEVEMHRAVLHSDLEDELPPVLGHGIELQQVLINLLLNGMEAMDEVCDRPRYLSIKSSRLPDAEVSVSVQDSGIGLAPDAIGRVFDTFYTTKPNGMGMGLAISRSIIQSHGGRIWATTGTLPGTKFEFVLPAVA